MNGRIFLLFLIFFHFFVNGHAQRCDSFFNIKPQKLKLKGNFFLKDTSLIKTTGVYLVKHVDENDTLKSVSLFYKFYTNGKVFISGIFCGKLLLSDLRDTTYGIISYYRIKGLHMEIANYGGGYIGYVIEKGIIVNPLKIDFLTYKPRKWFTNSVKYSKPYETIFIPIE